MSSTTRRSGGSSSVDVETAIRQGDFFFAEMRMSTDVWRAAPVLIIGADSDPKDVIVCSCTTALPRSQFDIEVELKKRTCVRANKIYTIERNQLQFKLPQQATPIQLAQIFAAIRVALNLA